MTRCEDKSKCSKKSDQEGKAEIYHKLCACAWKAYACEGSRLFMTSLLLHSLYFFISPYPHAPKAPSCTQSTLMQPMLPILPHSPPMLLSPDPTPTPAMHAKGQGCSYLARHVALIQVTHHPGPGWSQTQTSNSS